MFKISSENELLDYFRPSDREEVILPNDLSFPIKVKDYFTWVEPSGCRVYLVSKEKSVSSAPFGIVFRRDQSASSASVMCEWCHSVRTGENIGLLTARVTSKKRIGLNLCRDLSCKDKIENLVDSGQNREKVHRVIQRMTDFAKRELF